MSEPEEVTIEHVTCDQLEVLRKDFLNNEGKVSSGNEGFVSNPCFAAEFSYDPSSEILHLFPHRRMPNLTNTRLKRRVQAIISTKPQFEMDAVTGDTVYKPTPHTCAVYNWAIGFVTNNSDTSLTFSTSSTQHGNFENKKSPIPPGTQPSAREDGFWRNKGSKDSVTGCSGSLTYQLGDGVTTMIINYGVNTLSNTTASVGLSGLNASRYHVEVDKKTKFHSAAAYLYPYVTLSNA